jgi:hypothetical protein
MRSCSVAGCTAKHFGLSFCEVHYKRDYYSRNKEKVCAATRANVLRNPSAVRERQAKWYRANSPRLKERARIRYASDPVPTRLSTKRYQQKNKAKVKVWAKAWKQRNAPAVREDSLHRRCAQLNAEPKWVQRETILAIYKSRLPGQHVDHIIPLRHPLVSGLNVPWNLQLLSAAENNFKNNKFDGTYENNSWRKGFEAHVQKIAA